MVRFLAFLGFSLLSFNVTAKSTLPKGCQAVAIQGETVSLQAKKNSLIFIQNITPTDLWITHPVTYPNTNAGWTTRLQGKKWTALALKKGPFAINCIESRPGHEQQLPCEGAIAVCKWKKAKIPANNQNSSFWVAENMSLDELTAAVGASGIVTRAK